MEQLALDVKIHHVPSMLLCEIYGPPFVTRQSAIDGQRRISRRCSALGCAGANKLSAFITFKPGARS